MPASYPRRRWRRRRTVRSAWRLARRPDVGIIPPGQTITIVIDPPMQAHEQPAVFTPNALDLLLQDVQPERAVLANQTDRVVGYVFLVVPASITRIAALPWSQIFTYMRQEGGLFDQLKQLFGLPPRLAGK